MNGLEPARAEGDQQRRAGFRALVVDFGGVLTNSVWESFDAFCRLEGLEPDRLKRLFRENEVIRSDLARLELGEMSEAEFGQSLGTLLELTNTEGLVGRIFAGLTLDERMVRAVRACRASGLRTCLLSNSWGFGIYDRDLLETLFDTIVISAEVSMRKPQPDIYLLAAERVGVAPQECVYVDDLRANCTAAEAVGMTAILHRDPEVTLGRLEEILRISLRTR
jgi:epoxide hydrolase-like predicted phosphatase